MLYYTSGKQVTFMQVWRTSRMAKQEPCSCALASEASLCCRLRVARRILDVLPFNLICRCGGTADALVSGSSEEIRVGSNPVTCTM